MKKAIILISCLIISSISLAQFQQHRMLETVEVTPPEFTGVYQSNLTPEDYNSANNLNDFLLSHIEYPEEDAESFHMGVEVIRFMVSPNGDVGNFEVVNSVSKAIDDQVISALRQTEGMWLPGLNNLQPIAMEREVSIAFCCKERLTDNINEFFLEKARYYFDKGNKKLFFKDNPQGALNSYQRALCYQPYDTGLLMITGLCRYELGDESGACSNWNRIKSLGGFEGDFYLDIFCEMKGYDKLLSIVQTK